MMSSIKATTGRLPGGRLGLRVAARCRETVAFPIWLLRGRPSGDRFSFYKRHRLICEGQRYGCATLVETGTFLGDTVAVTRRHFERVLSVELSADLYQRAVCRFRHTPNVKLWQGDSGELMDEMCQHITGRAIFWLDGHYSGGITARGTADCPIAAELAAIGRHLRKDHLILIDDARCFGHADGYPTLSETRTWLLRINPNYQISVEDDCLIARPPAESR